MASGIISGIRNNRRAFVMFLLGIFIGGTCILFISGHKVESLLFEREMLYEANNQKYEDILKLQDEIAELTQTGADKQTTEEKIKKIAVEVISEEQMGTAVKKYAEDLLKPFHNKSIKWVSNNPDLVELVLQNQQVKINEGPKSKYRLHVKYLSFYHSTLKIWVIAEEVHNDDTTNVAS